MPPPLSEILIATSSAPSEKMTDIGGKSSCVSSLSGYFPRYLYIYVYAYIFRVSPLALRVSALALAPCLGTSPDTMYICVG